MPDLPEGDATIEKHYLTHKDQGFTVLAVNFRDKEENARKLFLEVAPIDYQSQRSPTSIDAPIRNSTGRRPASHRSERHHQEIVIGQQTITGGWFDGLKKKLEAALAESR